MDESIDIVELFQGKKEAMKAFAVIFNKMYTDLDALKNETYNDVFDSKRDAFEAAFDSGE